MDIVLDSNIFRSDFQLRSVEYNVILDYLKKTESYIVIPQIILDEVKGLYSRTMTERVTKLNSAINNFNLMLTGSEGIIKKVESDTSKETEKYERYLIDRLKIKKNKIVPLNNSYLPNVVNRAITRQRPCGDSGQGFRDAIIWLTLKDHCLACHEKQMIFISNNEADFGDSEKNELHPSLKQECDELGIKIHYYKTIKDFIEKHSTRIDFITYDWISERFDDDWLEDIILDDLNGRQTSRVVSWYSGETGNSCTGFFKAKNVYPDSQDDLSVYEMVDNTLVVNIVFGCEVEIEFEIYQDEFTRQSMHDYRYLGMPTTFDSRSMRCTAYVSITVKDGEIENVELNDLGY